ncbi:MAG: hypothetical protein Q9183_001601 [Haloplaca sp. 2 TL-2023]
MESEDDMHDLQLQFSRLSIKPTGHTSITLPSAKQVAVATSPQSPSPKTLSPNTLSSEEKHQPTVSVSTSLHGASLPLCLKCGSREFDFPAQVSEEDSETNDSLNGSDNDTSSDATPEPTATQPLIPSKESEELEKAILTSNCSPILETASQQCAHLIQDLETMAALCKNMGTEIRQRMGALYPRKPVRLCYRCLWEPKVNHSTHYLNMCHKLGVFTIYFDSPASLTYDLDEELMRKFVRWGVCEFQKAEI